ncbi:uncharacterized protein LOC110019937 isoform X1 [Phalaenopsis equestris]|uniref:uncharacterized protein LOC110019937 isoform X1 n=1 Tax=Phalaenopsis equestris TaxID=78828 RepID=UPI0009E1C663|nr:uncharacterized protein LOC110019937 isoform X1 [Phalaenopsis equestris]
MFASFHSCWRFHIGSQCRIHSSYRRRQLEHDVETVINVMQPGPLGIIEHRFSAEEVRKAKATAERAVNNWKMNASLGNKSHLKKNEDK